MGGGGGGDVCTSPAGEAGKEDKVKVRIPPGQLVKTRALEDETHHPPLNPRRSWHRLDTPQCAVRGRTDQPPTWGSTLVRNRASTSPLDPSKEY